MKVEGRNPARRRPAASAALSSQPSTSNLQPSTPQARIFVGTSGFSYPEWKGSFYPSDLPNAEMLRFYGHTFPTVELNNTFYRYPGEDTLAQWVASVPDGFRFSVKAHRRITHIKRLADIDGDLAFLYERMRGLGNGLGPLLFQLPPSLRYSQALLEGFLAGLRPGARPVMEFRHASWRQDAVYQQLEANHVGLCVAETDDEEQPKEVVGPVSYLRLHKSAYSEADLARWAEWMNARTREGRDVFAYFTHEDGAPAPDYARTLAQLAAPRS